MQRMLCRVWSEAPMHRMLCSRRPTSGYQPPAFALNEKNSKETAATGFEGRDSRNSRSKQVQGLLQVRYPPFLLLLYVLCLLFCVLCFGGGWGGTGSEAQLPSSRLLRNCAVGIASMIAPFLFSDAPVISFLTETQQPHQPASAPFAACFLASASAAVSLCPAVLSPAPSCPRRSSSSSPARRGAG